jgi:hypothetical protein
VARYFVIPVGIYHPVHIEECSDDKFVPVLRRVIGTARFDHTDLNTPWGLPIQVWVGDESLRGEFIEHNYRAIALMRDLGRDVDDVGGPAVITSYDPTSGDSVDPPPQVLMHLQGRAVDRGSLTTRAASPVRAYTGDEVEQFLRAWGLD